MCFGGDLDLIVGHPLNSTTPHPIKTEQDILVPPIWRGTIWRHIFNITNYYFFNKINTNNRNYGSGFCESPQFLELHRHRNPFSFKFKICNVKKWRQIIPRQIVT